MESFLADLRYALRKLAHTPGFTAVALLTLALGIGANSAIFSVVYGVLFRPMGFREPESLVVLNSAMRANTFSVFSAPNFADVESQARSFAGVAAFANDDVTLTGAGDPVTLSGARVSAGMFELLGVAPALGRTFRAGENEPGATDVVVLSHGLWRERFAGDAAIVGQTILLQRRPYQVIGVMPRGFQYPDGKQLWTPLEYDPGFRDPANRGAFFLGVVARLRPGADLAAANAELRAMAERIVRETPEVPFDDFSMSATPLRESLVGDVREPLIVLLGAVGFVLLIACANVANLLLARASIRGTEIAVRTALGAGRNRLARQLLTESVVLGVLGGAVGLLLALWGSAALVRLEPANLPRLSDVRVDGVVVAFTFTIALLASLLFGLAPALQATRGDPFDALREGGRGPMASRRGHRVRSALVVAELALAVLLLAGAGLLMRSFGRLLDQDPGFRADDVLTFRVQLPGEAYPDERRAGLFVATLLERVGALPGVVEAAGVSALPLSDNVFRIGFDVEGWQPRAPGREQSLDVRIATADYFRALGIPFRRGRGFEPSDRGGTLPVAVLNEAAVRQYFPNDDPLGRTIVLSWGRPGHEDTRGMVVGVAGDVRLRSLDREATPTIYLAHAQVPVGGLSFTVRSLTNAAALTPAIRELLRTLDPNLPLERVNTLEGVIADSVSQPRFYMVLLILFAAVALSLAGIGIFGVMSFVVAQRRREIGIRMALGARETSVLRLMLGKSLGLIAAGLLFGLLAASALTRLLDSLLFQVAPLDPLVLTGTALVLAATALAATWMPAQRAARLDPIVALRTE